MGMGEGKVNTRRLQGWLILCVALHVPLGCKCKPDPQPVSTKATPKESVTLSGAGASLPFPLYARWIAEYGKLHPEVHLTYRSTSSEDAVHQLSLGSIDFGTTDAPVTDAEQSGAAKRLENVPTIVGAVVVAYNLEGVSELKISPEVLAGIYLGKIKKWNDAKIAMDNSGVKLPSSDMNAVFRSDRSGTTDAFTDYLSKTSEEFRDEIGRGKLVSWAVGVGAMGSEGVIGQVKSIPGAIGYLDLAQATDSGLQLAAIRNKAGEFIRPSSETISLAARGVPTTESLTVSLTDSSVAGAYPISAYSYVIVPHDSADVKNGKALADFLSWAVHAGQQHAVPLHGAPLPPSMLDLVQARVEALRSAQGKPSGG
jgi:phosphate transport system substrate-binding protein